MTDNEFTILRLKYEAAMDIIEKARKLSHDYDLAAMGVSIEEITALDVAIAKYDSIRPSKLQSG